MFPAALIARIRAVVLFYLQFLLLRCCVFVLLLVGAHLYIIVQQNNITFCAIEKCKKKQFQQRNTSMNRYDGNKHIYAK